jgi:hypothetical protein
MRTVTPTLLVETSHANLRWIKAEYDIKAAIATGDLAAYTVAQAQRQQALSDLEQVEEASFISPEAMTTTDNSLM